MKIISYLREPNNTGIALFGLAATILIAIIGAGSLGLVATAQLLNQVAQPICAAAIGVLMYLALVARQLEKANADR